MSNSNLDRARRLCRLVLAAAVGCTVLLVSTPTFADPAAQARFHDELARKHYAKGRYEEALREFFQEQRLAPNPRIAFNIALCFEQLDRREDAYSFFDEYLRSNDEDGERRAYATAAIDQLMARVARVHVASTPAGATIYVDEEEHGDYGQTPRTIAVRPGARRIWARMPGHLDSEVTLEARTGSTAQAQLSLQRILGTLRVESAAAGEVEVRSADGETVAHGAAPLWVDIPPGTYEVGVSAPGHAPWKAVAVVRKEDVTVKSAVPQKLPPPSGDLTVTANISGALLEVDGQPSGFTPTVLGSLDAGAHEIRVRGEGMVSWTGQVDVKPDERLWVTVTLEEPPVKMRSPATWVVGACGIASLASAGIVGAFAARNHRDFENASPDQDRSGMIDRGRKLNVASDVLLGVGIAGLGAAVALYFGTAETRGRPSSASVARGAK